MKIFYTDHYVLPLPPGHRFPMRKYGELRERVTRAPWLEADMLHEPHAATDAELARTHCMEYVRRVQSGELDNKAMRRIGFPWTPEMLERSRRSAGATVEACFAALAEGCGVNLAGGTHHAFRDFGEGFCVFNDAVVAARSASERASDPCGDNRLRRPSRQRHGGDHAAAAKYSSRGDYGGRLWA